MGKKKTSAPPPAPSPTELAQAQVEAQLAALPRAQRLSFDLLRDPETGLRAQTQLQEDVRRQVFAGESGVRDALVQNVLGQLQSPTGITPEQQAAVSARRGEAQSELQRALRTRANLGGGLFGGRAQRTEERAVGDLQARFAEEDIGREERARLNAIQSALPLLQLLFPQAGIVAPQFINPVASPETATSAALQARGQDIGLQQSELARRSALQSALFQGLGGALSASLGQGGFLAPRTD